MQFAHKFAKVWLVTAATVLGVSVAVAAPAGASVGGGNVSITWNFSNNSAPPAGVDDVTFPMTVEQDTAHLGGTYFAQQFSFTGGGAVGYTGLQPEANIGSQERMAALFSSFDGTSTSAHPNCHSGADGGAGTSCRIVFNATYGHTYDLKVTRPAIDTWHGAVVDTVTGESISIGQWSIPGSGQIRTGQVGFVEYFAGVPSCQEMPRVNVLFGGPYSTSANLTGQVVYPYEYSDCVGQTTYSATNVGTGLRVIRGNTLPTALINDAANLCLDNLAGSNETPALYGCHGGGNQAWYAAGAGELKNNGVCLDAAGAQSAAGTSVILWGCHAGSNQQWTRQSDGTIKGSQSGRCIGLAGGATTSETRLVLADCTGAADQVWRVQ